MAESLTPWMAKSVCQSVPDIHRSSKKSAKRHLQPKEIEDETSFQRGSKVQIVRFLGFDGDSTYQSFHQNNSALWAIVADRSHWICVKFSKDCVALFDRMHSRKLISMRGSIIGLQWYRPGASIRAEKLYSIETNSRGDGPFAAALRSNLSGLPSDLIQCDMPRLFLQVESVQLWGSVNENIFWETEDLQNLLLEDPKILGNDMQVEASLSLMIDKEHRSAFKKWMVSIRRQHIRSLRNKDQKKIGNTNTGSSSSDQFSIESEMSLPKPYQEPAESKSHKRQAVEQASETNEKKKKKSEKENWKDFSLGWADDDYGLQSAADELFQQKDDQSSRVSGTETDFSDPFALALPDQSDEPSSTEVINLIQPSMKEGTKSTSFRFPDDRENDSLSKKEEKTTDAEENVMTSHETQQNSNDVDVNWSDILDLVNE